MATATSNRLSAREAVEIAQTALTEFYPKEQIRALRLEAFEPSDDKKLWLVTYSFTPPGGMFATEEASSLLGPLTPPRVYKRVRVNASDGSIESLEMADPRG